MLGQSHNVAQHLILQGMADENSAAKLIAIVFGSSHRLTRATQKMDIQRPASVAQAKKRRQYMYGAIAVLVIVGVSVVLARLRPAAPTVERATVWVDTVKRGPMVRQVRGLGTLVPVDEARRWVPASTQGRVERIVLRPGVQVTPDTVVLELSDPNVQQALNDAEQQLRQAEANFNSLKATLDAESLNQRSQAAIVAADHQ